MLLRLAKRSAGLRSPLRARDQLFLLQAKQHKTPTNNRRYSNSPQSVELPDALQQKPVNEWKVEDVILWSSKISGFPRIERDRLKEEKVDGPALLALQSSKPFKTRENLLKKAIQQLRYTHWSTMSMMSFLKEYKLRDRTLGSMVKSAVGTHMPLVGCEETVAVAWEPVVHHFAKQSHSLIFAVGARGIGKTRFGGEFDQLLLSYGKQNHAQQQPELIKALENVMYIPISIGEDLQWGSFDGKYKGQKQVDWMLTVRAIYKLFEITEPFKVFAAKLQSSFGPNLPEFFNLHALKNYLLTEMVCSAKPSMIYWHLDDIHLIHQKNPDLAANIIYHLKDLYVYQDQVPTLLLIGGDTFSDVRKTVAKKVGSQLQPVVLPFNALNESGVNALVQNMCKQHNLEWAKDKQEFKDIIESCGGVPKLIQTVFEMCLELKDSSYFGVDMKKLTKEVGKKTLPNWPQDKQLHEAYWLTFLGKEVASDPTLSNGSHLIKEEVKSNGYVYYKEITTANSAVKTVVPFMPFMFFRNAPADYMGHLAKVYQPAWEEFHNQGFNLNGIDLWKFALQLHVLKTTSFKELGLSCVPFADYYKLASYSNLQNFKTAKLEAHSMNSKLVQDYVTFIQKSKSMLQPFDLLYLTKTGVVDCFQFVKTDHLQHPVILMIHQNHFTGDGKADCVFDANTVNLELEKIEKEFNDWLNKNNMPKAWTKPLTFVTVFYTNRAMEQNFETELAKYPEALKKDFIIVSDAAYFGPFESVFNRVRAQAN